MQNDFDKELTLIEEVIDLTSSKRRGRVET